MPLEVASVALASYKKNLSTDYLITFSVTAWAYGFCAHDFFEAIGRYDWVVFYFCVGGWVVCPRNRENA